MKLLAIEITKPEGANEMQKAALQVSFQVPRLQGAPDELEL